MMDEKYHAFRAFMIFHLRVGTRLALKRLAPTIAAVFASYYLLRPEFFDSLMASFSYVGSLFMGLIFAFISLGIASTSVPRVYLGLDGWIRHLPSSSLLQRRLANLAISVAQLPILSVLCILVLLSCKSLGISPIVYLVGLPVLGIASAQCVLPVQHRIIARPLAFAACLFSVSGNWAFVLGSLILLIIADVFSGPLSTIKKHPRFHWVLRSPMLYLIICWRALKLRTSIPFLLFLFILGATALFIHNNNLNTSLIAKVICLGGALSITVIYALLADMLALRRPPWPWARSLPWSSQKRILMDSFFLFIHAIPVLILITLINFRVVWPLAVSLPLFTFYASLVIRTAPEYRLGAQGKIFLMGIMGAISIALIPYLSFGYFALTPLSFRHAVKKEKCQKVTRWLELHHLAAGDSLSWSR